MECERGAFATCFGDEIRQVVANLVSNALDATSEGEVAGAGAADGSWTRGMWVEGVKIVVADTGQGIPAAVVDHIFEPFVTTKEATGIGLGLWVSDGIVRKHGGWIRVRSLSEGRSDGDRVRDFYSGGGAGGGRVVGAACGRFRDGAEWRCGVGVAWVRVRGDLSGGRSSRTSKTRSFARPSGEGL